MVPLSPADAYNHRVSTVGRMSGETLLEASSWWRYLRVRKLEFPRSASFLGINHQMCAPQGCSTANRHLCEFDAHGVRTTVIKGKRAQRKSKTKSTTSYRRLTVAPSNPSRSHCNVRAWGYRVAAVRGTFSVRRELLIAKTGPILCEGDFIVRGDFFFKGNLYVTRATLMYWGSRQSETDGSSVEMF